MKTVLFVISFLTAALFANNSAQEAFELRMQGKNSEAKDIITNLLKEHPENAVYYYEQSRIEFYLKDFESAQRAIEKAVELDNHNPEYNYFMGLVSVYHSIYMYHEKRMIELPFQNQKAIKALEKAVDLKPDFHRARKLLVDIYNNNTAFLGGNKGKARKHTERLERMDPVWGARARCVIMDHGKIDEKIELYKSLIEKNPPNGALHADISLLFAAGKQFEMADRHIDRALSLDRGCWRKLLNLAFSAAQDKQYDKARSYVERYIDSNPSSAAMKAYATFYLSQIEAKKGNMDRSQRLCEEYRKIDVDVWTTMQSPPEELFTGL